MSRKKKGIISLVIVCLALLCVGGVYAAGKSVNKNNSSAQKTESSESRDKSSSSGSSSVSTSSETASSATSSSQSTSSVSTSSEVTTSSSSQTEAAAEQAPTFTYTDMTDTTMYATSKANVRNQPDKSGQVVGSLKYAQDATVTGKCNETGWYRIRFNNGEAYVSNALLTKEQPVQQTQSQTTAEQAPAQTQTSAQAQTPAPAPAPAAPMTYTDTGNAQLNSLCDGVLNSILTSGMGERERASAIYTWTQNHMSTGGPADASDWVSAAIHEENKTDWKACNTGPVLRAVKYSLLGYCAFLYENHDA